MKNSVIFIPIKECQKKYNCHFTSLTTSCFNYTDNDDDNNNELCIIKNHKLALLNNSSYQKHD